MAKRVELGQFTGGGYGLRVSRPGYDVSGGAAVPMLFDSDLRLVQAIYRGSMLVDGARQIFSTNPPYGQPGAETTAFTISGRFTFPIALDGPKLCQFYFDIDINGIGRRRFNETFMPRLRYQCTATEVRVDAGHSVGGNVTYARLPIVTVTVLNVPGGPGLT